MKEQLMSMEGFLRALNGSNAQVKSRSANFENDKLRKNMDRQMRSEYPATFVTLRTAPLPATDVYEPYQILAQMSEDQRRLRGNEIFEMVYSYLKLLAARKMWPRGDLAE
jgi:hypothetical protein